MHRDLVDRLAAEAGTCAAGRAIQAVLARPGDGLALVLDGPEHVALDLAPGPPEPRLALTRRSLATVPGGPADALRARLVGRRLADVAVQPTDRIVRFGLDDRSALVLEILGPLSNLYYVGADGLVALRARPCSRPGGAELRVGEPWAPLSGTGQWQAPAAAAATAPGVAMPWNPESADALRALRPGELALRVDGPLPEDVWFEAHTTLGDAATRRHEILARHADADGRRLRLAARVRGARQRLERLLRGLAADERGAGEHERMRREATAILAGLPRVMRTPTGLRVPDPWGSGDGWIEVAAPQGHAPTRVADDLFREAGRLERGLERLRERARRAAQHLERVVALDTAVAAIDHSDTLATLEGQAEALLPAPAARHSGVAPPGLPRRQRGRLLEDPRSRRIRRLETPEGWPVFIGGSAADNDWLTFRIANGHDFWLHAADYPGAHVVVRNPARQSDPPPTVLHQAAAWALHFSKAPRAERGTVRWTQVRHLRRSRGAPPGTVFLSRFATLSVTPAPPPGRDPFGPT